MAATRKESAHHLAKGEPANYTRAEEEDRYASMHQTWGHRREVAVGCLSEPGTRDNGFEGIDIPLEDAVSAEHYRESLDRFHLKAGGAGLPVRVTEDKAEFTRQITRLPALAAKAQAIGVTRFMTWILSFSDRLSWKENFTLHATQLGEAARILKDHSCRLGLEFLGPKTLREGHRFTFIHTMEQMLDLGEATGENVGLLLDAYRTRASSRRSRGRSWRRPPRRRAPWSRAPWERAAWRCPRGDRLL